MTIATRIDRVLILIILEYTLREPYHCYAKTHLSRVLILIILEYTLRVLALVTSVRQRISLNPYYTGIYSTRT